MVQHQPELGAVWELLAFGHQSQIERRTKLARAGVVKESVLRRPIIIHPQRQAGVRSADRGQRVGGHRAGGPGADRVGHDEFRRAAEGAAFSNVVVPQPAGCVHGQGKQQQDGTVPAPQVRQPTPDGQVVRVSAYTELESQTQLRTFAVGKGEHIRVGSHIPDQETARGRAGQFTPVELQRNHA